MSSMNPVEVDYTDRDGKRIQYIKENKKQACDYARLMNELGCHIHQVTDLYSKEDIDWRRNNDPLPKG